MEEESKSTQECYIFHLKKRFLIQYILLHFVYNCAIIIIILFKAKILYKIGLNNLKFQFWAIYQLKNSVPRRPDRPDKWDT